MVLLLGVSLTQAHGVRDRTRLSTQDRDTAVSASQAVELTLTLVETAPQVLQTWVRTAATIDDAGKVISTTLCSHDRQLVQLGQRVRAFPPDSKSSIYQARISSISKAINQPDCLVIEANLARPTYEQSPFYVMEIITQRGLFLAIPSEAIIDEGDRQIVYVYMPDPGTGDNSDDSSNGATDTVVDANLEKTKGHYMPREIQLGLQGELYTEVIDGLSAGEQVVTLGSFFIDADYKLKLTDQANASNAHHHH